MPASPPAPARAILSSRVTGPSVTVPATALLVALAVAAAGTSPAFLPAVALAFATPLLCVWEARERRLPNGIVLPVALAAGLGVAGEWARSGRPPLLALGCGLAALVVLGALALAGGMGMGDAKLAGVLGIAGGLLGPLAALAAPALAVLLGGLVAFAAARSREPSLPFGPCLLGGFWIAVVLAAFVG